MASIDSIHRVAGQIYDAATDPRLWPGVLEHLRGELSAAGAVLIEYDFATQFSGVLASTGTRAEFDHQFEHGLARQIPWLRDGPWYAPGRVSLGNEIIPDAELARSAVYNEWLKPQGFFHRLCGVIRRRDSRVLYVGLSRPQARGRYDDQEARYLGALLPHLRRATRLNRQVLRSQAIWAAFEHLPYGVFVLDGAGRPMLMNPAAEDLLTTGAGLRLDGNGRLAVADAATTARLRSALAVAGREACETRFACNAIATDHSGSDHPPLSLSVLPIGAPSRDVISGASQTLVLAFPPRAAEWQEGELRALYGLTAAEERLARLILEGYRLDQAQESLGIRHSTARTHMRRIYAKTGTRRQAELVRLLTTGQAPSDPAER